MRPPLFPPSPPPPFFRLLASPSFQSFSTLLSVKRRAACVRAAAVPPSSSQHSPCFSLRMSSLLFPPSRPSGSWASRLKLPLLVVQCNIRPTCPRSSSYAMLLFPLLNDTTSWAAHCFNLRLFFAIRAKLVFGFLQSFPSRCPPYMGPSFLHAPWTILSDFPLSPAYARSGIESSFLPKGTLYRSLCAHPEAFKFPLFFLLFPPLTSARS